MLPPIPDPRGEAIDLTDDDIREFQRELAPEFTESIAADDGWTPRGIELFGFWACRRGVSEVATLTVYQPPRETHTFECMQISEQRILEFRRLWKEEFGEDLSVEEARHEATLLLELYSALAEPLPNELQPLPNTKE